MKNKSCISALCLPVLFGLSAMVDAASYVVDKSGAGDFTTIQAAVDQAASVESVGNTRGYAYFTQGSDVVSIWGGMASLQDGMLISVDDRSWYEISEIIDAETIRIARAYDDVNRFNSYKAAEVSNINIRPGTYVESINLQNAHFIRFKGTGPTRESVVIQPPEDDDATPFYNVQDYGSLYLTKLTARSIATTPIIRVMNETPNINAPSDMNLTLFDVHLDANCCDGIYSPYGHVSIDRSRLEGENDVLGGYFKSLTIKRSVINSLRTMTIMNAGKAVFVKLLYDSLIENSLIQTVSHDPSNPSSGNGVALALYGTNGNVLTIRNSIVMSDGGSGGTALHMYYGGTSIPSSSVALEGSRVLARSLNSTAKDIEMRASDTVTAKCSEYATVVGGGAPTVLSCP